MTKERYVAFLEMCEKCDGYSLGEEVWITQHERSIPCTIVGRTLMGNLVIDFADYYMEHNGERQNAIVPANTLRRQK